MKMTNNVHVGEIVFIVTAEHEESELAAYLNGEKTKYTIMPAEICDITEEGNIRCKSLSYYFSAKEDVMNLEFLHWKITFLHFTGSMFFRKRLKEAYIKTKVNR